MIRHILTILVLLVAPYSSYAVELEGAWKSDAAYTERFNEKYAKLKNKQKVFLSELFGNMTVTYKNEIMYQSMPTIKVSVNGIPQDFIGFNKKSSYKIIAKNDDTIVLNITDSEGKSEIALMKFESKDRYWVYLPNSSSKWSQLHIREYFVRQK